MESLTLPPLSSATVCIVKEAVPRAQNVHSPQQPQETKEPKEISPEAVKENVDVKDGPVELAHAATGEQGGEREEDKKEPQQEEPGISMDPDMLRYLDKLVNQDDLVNKVGWLQAPRSTRFQSVALQHPGLVSAQEDRGACTGDGCVGVSLWACVYVVCVMCSFQCVYVGVPLCLYVYMFLCVRARLELMTMSSKTLTLCKRIGWVFAFLLFLQVLLIPSSFCPRWMKSFNPDLWRNYFPQKGTWISWL